MPGQRSSGEREFLTLVAQLQALEQEIAAARETAQRAERPRGLDLHIDHDPAPAVHGERVALPDGAEIVIRPIEPDDARELAAGFGRLGALSRFRLFREPVDRLSQQQLGELSHPDHQSQETLVAFDARTGEGIGLARYVRTADDPAHAQVACAVVDAWQHRGVGSALAERLAARARAAGIERCTALILLGNQPARRLLAHVADEIGERRDGGTVDVTARPKGSEP